MSIERDAITVLGVKPGATPAEINEAFRERSKILHPDTGGSHELQAALSAARDFLLGDNKPVQEIEQNTRICPECKHFNDTDGWWKCRLSKNYQLGYGIVGVTTIYTSHMRAAGGLQSRRGPCGPDALLWEPIVGIAQEPQPFAFDMTDG